MNNDPKSRLIVIIGPSGVGKSSILHYLEQKYAIESKPKYTTRPSRNTEEDAQDFIFCSSNDFPTESILTFESYSHLFGIQLNAIEQSFKSHRSHATIVGHSDVVKQLTTIFKDRVVVIFVFCEIPILKDRVLGTDMSRSDRWSKILEEINNIYSDIGCVNFIINNSGSLQNTFGQVDSIMSMLIGSQL